MTNTNPNFADFQKGYDAGAADVAGMGFNAARDKFNMDFIPGKPIRNAGQLAWALGYFEALTDRAA
jgi:hypothetical protein